MSEIESPADTLRRAAVRMRVDAFTCGDETTDFIPAVADWLDSLSDLEPHVLRWQHGPALTVARAYLGERP